MEGLTDYYRITKEEAIHQIVMDSLGFCSFSKPFLLQCPFSFTPNKSWKKLPENGYMFKETGLESHYNLVFIVKNPIKMPSGEMHSIHLNYPSLEDQIKAPIVISYACD